MQSVYDDKLYASISISSLPIDPSIIPSELIGTHQFRIVYI